MRIAMAEIAGVVLDIPQVRKDERGFLCVLDPAAVPAPTRRIVARSRRGVIRGMHFRPPPGEAKLVRCSAGRIYDVVVDLRPDSRTYRNRVCGVLSGAAQHELYIPAGCAHGYQALEDDTDVTYLIDMPYDPVSDLAIAWNDPELGIQWPLTPLASWALSGRDKNAPSLAEVEKSL